MVILLRPTALLMAISTLLCLILPIFAPRPLETAESWHYFHFDACELPCFSGITPGKTSFQNAPSLLRRNLAQIGTEIHSTGLSLQFIGSTLTRDFAGFARADQGVVSDMSIVAIVPVDHLIEQLGMPDCILLSDQSDVPGASLFWVRDSVAINAVLDQFTLTLRANVKLLYMYAFETDVCAHFNAPLWHGFAPAWKYTN
jgi:hypothetical protein